MKTTIKNNYDSSQMSEKIDIIIPSENSSSLRVSYVDFKFDEYPNHDLTVKIFLNEDIDELIEFNFCHFKNIDLVFYRFMYQW
ncbi:hypothetical protein SAMN05444387_2802 [Flavobacterium pectinovorum]|uniref:Uncharacterized protein n=2 Tax=Flavobacterium pectinovorum TaxID=29533 RepID=A0AB36NVL2_9FLAO|nr:hypothetical protein B0A72_21205 [Flavobacterium pectinovorum]SHM55496.1 hypothetical protein SAMN05444387_2802 [Flavobacterium pectinovorum]